jgi:hypothetical protein
VALTDAAAEKANVPYGADCLVSVNPNVDCPFVMPGTYEITAIYSGDSAFSQSSGQATAVISQTFACDRLRGALAAATLLEILLVERGNKAGAHAMAAHRYTLEADIALAACPTG